MLIQTKNDNTKLDYSKPIKKMNSDRDLTPADKQYLKGQGVSPAEFDKMDATSQNEWKAETREGAYAKSFDIKLAKGRMKAMSLGENISQERWDQIFKKNN